MLSTEIKSNYDMEKTLVSGKAVDINQQLFSVIICGKL